MTIPLIATFVSTERPGGPDRLSGGGSGVQSRLPPSTGMIVPLTKLIVVASQPLPGHCGIDPLESTAGRWGTDRPAPGADEDVAVQFLHHEIVEAKDIGQAFEAVAEERDRDFVPPLTNEGAS